MRINKKLLLVCLVSFGVLLSLFRVHAEPVTSQSCEVTVGIAMPTSVDWGRPLAATSQLAVDLMNEAGGVDGCAVKTVLRDTQSDPKVGLDAARAMVDLNKIQLLLGPVASGVSMPILTSVTVPANVMQISCCTSSTAFTKLAAAGKTKGLWFRTFATSSVQATAGSMMLKDMQAKRVAIFYKNDDWGQDIGAMVAKNLKAQGIEVTAEVAINDAQSSYQAEVVQAFTTQPDALYLALYPKEGISVVRNWLSFGGTRKMVVANALKSDEFRDSVGLQYLGNVIGTDTSSPRVQSANDFVSLYKARFGSEPNAPGIGNSFDAAMIAMLAYEAAGKDAKGPEIAKQVARVTDPNGTPVEMSVAGLKAAKATLAAGGTLMYQGATGNVTFDGNGDVSAPAVTWTYSANGIQEQRYISLEEIAALGKK